MSIQFDFHLHSSFSGDCHVPMEQMILSGIEKGLKSMCFTEHNDFDFPDVPDENVNTDTFLLNVDSYLYELLRLRDKYADQVKILFGIEIGLQKSCMKKNNILSKSYDFDFIIASSHLCMGTDPYYPSFFEGFGLPILEAMKSGCPVMCSETTSMPEVGGEAAEYFNPYDVDSIVDTIERVVFNENKMNEMKKKSIVQAEKFSYKKAAFQTLEVYQGFE